ncbi:thioredoxin domain protein [Bernardetia litoralis DSM 6794]|uniref:Thioredoxin domain protein n=1 Tax=Bernardetia litoralis (strain ATCC 23117 / DSM 6794 / NBRC 15988 / NCIMB 1366 / Fx l1 / Sio-4) TaxID=880071 RepID=I4AN96_BERLS|nr:thioredoxin family protein [Bernardetia litoralis]AFM05431.1 thioredoxin domain protein [Bernardetia litoralis DSM 6794]
MKKITLLAALIFCFFAVSGFVFFSKNEVKERHKTLEKTTKKEKIEWLTFQEAMKKSAQDNKPIFVDVYTDWCGWCKKMDKNTFQTDDVVEYVAQNYHAVKLDAESEDATSFDGQKLTYRQLSGGVFKVTGYPSIVLINSKKQVAVAPGYRGKDDFVKMLEQFKTANQ